jgi:hypothetical protein
MLASSRRNSLSKRCLERKTFMGHFKLIGPGTDGLYKYGGATIELSNLGTRRWYVTIRFKNQEVDLDEYPSSKEALEAAMAWVDAAPEHPRDFHGRPRPLGETRYPKLPEPKHHFVSRRAETKRDRRRDQYVYVDDLRVGDVIYDNTGEATVVSVSDSDQSGYRSVEVTVNGEQKTFRYYGESTVPIKRRVSGSVREGHRVADFNTLDDLVAHARQEGATHVLRIDDEVHLYFKRRDGSYEKSEVWQKDGYWHTQGPGSRVIVKKPPENAKPIAVVRERRVEAGKRDRRRDQYVYPEELRIGDIIYSGNNEYEVVSNPVETANGTVQIDILVNGIATPRFFQIGMATIPIKRRTSTVRDYIAVDPRDRQVAGPFKHYSDARKEADNAGGIVKFVPSRTVRAPSAAHRRTARGAEARGEQYAQDQLQGEYFQGWIREQLLEASRMDPSQVLPLETKRDAMVIARNMLQDLEEGAKRDLNEDAAFWKGFRSALDDSREWLADELLQIKSEMGDGRMNETPQRATGIRARGARVEYAGSDPMKRGRTGTVITHSATDQVRVQWDGTGAGHDELIHVSNLRLLGGEKRRPKAKRSAPRRRHKR